MAAAATAESFTAPSAKLNLLEENAEQNSKPFKEGPGSNDKRLSASILHEVDPALLLLLLLLLLLQLIQLLQLLLVVLSYTIIILITHLRPQGSYPTDPTPAMNPLGLKPSKPVLYRLNPAAPCPKQPAPGTTRTYDTSPTGSTVITYLHY